MHESDPRRRACDELAELLATPEGLRTARLLQLTEALEPRAIPVAEIAGGQAQRSPGGEPKRARAISIWQPRYRDGELVFERPASHPLGDHHARRRTLVANRQAGKARVCFFGESAAAGYLYAPYLTPAEVLERDLVARSANGCEVIDLARTNETLGSMLTTVEHSLQLDPDLLVIFTGNNWNLLETPDISAYVPSVRARQRVALALRRGGLAGLVDLSRRDLKNCAKQSLARVAHLARRGGAARDRPMQVIVVIPEVNLGSWQDRQPVSWLPADGSRRWHGFYAEAVADLAAGRAEAALSLATACSTSMVVCARPAIVCGQKPWCGWAARKTRGQLVKPKSRAAAMPPSASWVPLRAARSVAELLRREAARHGFAVVDLPRLFAAHPAPDRLFLDYCHLSAEGIELAMAAVTESVLDATEARDGEGAT